ncbi:MAG: O-antigen ligase family protein [Patescibacteria group bacterium]
MNRFYLSLVVLYILLLVVFNNTTLFVSFALLSGLLFLFARIKRVDEVLWYTLLASLPFDLGKSFSIPVVTPTPGLQEIGYRVWITISPSLVLAFLLLLYLWIHKRRTVEFRPQDKFWLLLLIFSIASSLQGVFKSVAFYGWLELFKGVAIYFAARGLLKDSSILKRSLTIIYSWLFFEGFLSFWQFIIKGSLGRYIEEGVANIAFGRIVGESQLLFRSFGTFVSPNRMAAFLTLSLIVASFAFFKPSFIGKSSRFVFLSFVFGVIGLILSLSRTSWFAFTLFLSLAAAGLLRKKYKLDVEFKKAAVIVLAGLFLLAPFLSTRIGSIFTAFSFYGTGSVRLKLIQEGLHLVSLKPILGVGLNHFTWAITKWPATDIRFIFLQRAHNV